MNEIPVITGKIWRSDTFDLDFDIKPGLLQLYQETLFSEKFQDLAVKPGTVSIY